MTTTSISRALVGSFAAGAVVLALCAGVSFAHAQMPTYQLAITTQLASGTVAPATLPTITVTANGPSFSSVPGSSSATLTYTSNFLNDARTVTAIPGSYNVVASGGGYYYAYSTDCAGLSRSGDVRTCVVTLSTTPPQSYYPCASWYGSTYNGCVNQVVPYVGPLGQTPLTCSPSYQTVAAGQPVTFTAQGGGAYANSTYNWTTTDRTFLNTGATLSTVLQTTGVQTVIVTNGTQSATCTVNSVAAPGAIIYNGSNTGVNTPVITSTVSAAVPTLPNTGYEPIDYVSIAFTLVFLLAGSIVALPYVRKTTHAIIG